MASPPAGKKPAPRKTTKKSAAPSKETAGKAASAPKRNADGIKKATRKSRATVKNESKREPLQLGLTEKQQRFVDEYLVDLNATQAAIRAGYSVDTARAIGHENLTKPDIQLALLNARKQQQERTNITADGALREAWNIATADARELVDVRVGCCRCCYGEGHKHQRTLSEYNRDREAWREKGQDPAQFDEAGGIGFNPLLQPHPQCPVCGGDGQARAVLKDTRNLSEKAVALYAGAKQTQYGIEIKMQDKGAALEKLFKHLGLYEKDNQQKADPLAALLRRIATGNSSSLLPVADDPEAPAAPAAGGSALLPREDVPDGD